MQYIKSNKIFYHPDRIKAYLNGGMVIPITVKIYLTDRCNLRCNYCVYKDRLNSNEMNEEDVIPIFDNLMRMGVKGIVFTGGEPTCYPDFKKVVKYAKEICNFDLGLITNGVIYPDVLEYLTWIRFSLDTVSRTIYNKIKGKDKLLIVFENIHRAVAEKIDKKLNITIGVQMVVTKENYKEIEVFIAYWDLFCGIDYCQIRPLENYKYTNKEWNSIQKQLDTIKKTKHNIEIITTEYKWEELKNNYCKTYEECPGADFIGSVDTKGDFYICCTMVKDKTAKYGNLITDNIDKILLNRKVIQANFDYSKCPIACQGSLMNKDLVAFKNIKHVNFI